ncbi:hypothetical protein [Streptomyces sp. NPDC059862]|uniref:hypothetical protein n=1 Tax=unclassified Streptomyces TaxID=2593676 RepID=UPI003643E927
MSGGTMSRWSSARPASADGRQPRADHMPSSGMPPGHKKQLPKAASRRAGRGPAVINGRTDEIQALTALLDKHATATARLSRGDMVADR